MNFKSKDLLSLPIILAATIQFSLATSFFIPAFPELIKTVPTIIRGKVGIGHSDWSQDLDGTQRLYTFYELHISEVLKGDISSNRIVMRELGGESNGVSVHVPGSAKFERDDDVVVLLTEKNKEGFYDIFGMSTGKFNLQKDPDGTEFLVGPGIISGSSLPPQKWTLDGLRNLIHPAFPSPLQTPLQKLNAIENALPSKTSQFRLPNYSSLHSPSAISKLNQENQTNSTPPSNILNFVKPAVLMLLIIILGARYLSTKIQ